MSPTVNMALRYAVGYAVMFALGRGWLTSEQAAPVTDAVMTLAGVVVAAAMPLWAGLKVDNGPKK